MAKIKYDCPNVGQDEWNGEFSQLAGHVVWYTALESKLAIPAKFENAI